MNKTIKCRWSVFRSPAFILKPETEMLLMQAEAVPFTSSVFRFLQPEHTHVWTVGSDFNQDFVSGFRFI